MAFLNGNSPVGKATVYCCEEAAAYDQLVLDYKKLQQQVKEYEECLRFIYNTTSNMNDFEIIRKTLAKYQGE